MEAKTVSLTLNADELMILRKALTSYGAKLNDKYMSSSNPEQIAHWLAAENASDDLYVRVVAAHVEAKA